MNIVLNFKCKGIAKQFQKIGSCYTEYSLCSHPDLTSVHQRSNKHLFYSLYFEPAHDRRTHDLLPTAFEPNTLAITLPIRCEHASHYTTNSRRPRYPLYYRFESTTLSITLPIRGKHGKFPSDFSETFCSLVIHMVLLSFFVLCGVSFTFHIGLKTQMQQRTIYRTSTQCKRIIPLCGFSEDFEISANQKGLISIHDRYVEFLIIAIARKKKDKLIL